MRISRRAATLLLLAVPLLLPSLTNPSFGQSAGAGDAKIDPLALDVLHAATDSVKNAKTFSFRALVAKERLGTNDQIVTLFRLSDVTISHPNKLRIRVITDGETVDIFDDGANATLYVPDKKLYSTVSTGNNLDKMVDGLQARDVEIPLAPLFRSDPYKTLSEGLVSADVIGRVTIEGRTFHHLVFTEKDADWQAWVEAGAKPTLRRVEVVYKNMPKQPRVTIDFTNWNLNATPAADFFSFRKPADAKEISFLKTGEGQSK